MAPKSTRPREPAAIVQARALLDDYFAVGEEHVRPVDYREGALRLVVIDMHLAIEDLLKFFLFGRLCEGSSFTNRENERYVRQLKSRQTIDLSARLGVIDKPLHAELVALNETRNHAGHIWSLNEYKMVTAGGRKRRRYPLVWKGKRLTMTLMQAEFLPWYGDIYTSLFSAYIELLPDP
jgi:hypothetical protein